MNAAIFAKSSKALILATGLIAASTIISSAQDVPVPLGAQATIPLSSWYVAPPSGQALLGGHTFDLSGGNLLQLANGQSVSFAGSYPNTKGAFLLLNTSNTYSFFTGSVVGQVVLTFSDGTTQSTDLTVGTNIREWRISAGATVNTLVAGSGTTQVWSGTAQPGMGGGAAVIDMLAITVPTAGKTLTTVKLNDTNGWGALRIQLAGLTIDDGTVTTTCGKAKTKHHEAKKADKHIRHCDQDTDEHETDVENDDSQAAAGGEND